MEMTLSNGFCEMSNEEITLVEGGGALDFMGDIYDSWCDMWHDFGANLYYIING